LFFILDATCYCIEPGTITLVPLEKYNPLYNNYITKHDFSLLNVLYNNKNISGYIIGIEIDKITFDINLSKVLDDKFVIIREKIKSLIKTLKYCPNNMDISIIQNQINCLN
jgi:Ni,Fe-hydrogenase maturation factor